MSHEVLKSICRGDAENAQNLIQNYSDSSSHVIVVWGFLSFRLCRILYVSTDWAKSHNQFKNLTRYVTHLFFFPLEFQGKKKSKKQHVVVGQINERAV